MATPLYISPNSTSTSCAAGVRCKYFSRELAEATVVSCDRDLWMPAPDHRWPTPLRLAAELAQGIEAALRIVANRPRYVVISSPGFVVMLLASLACRLRRIPYILDIRDIYPETLSDLSIIKESSVLYKLLRHRVRAAYDASQGITTATKGIENLVRMSGTSTDTTTIYNGYDPDVFFPESDKRDRPTVVFHGNLSRLQDVDAIVAVADRIDERFDVVVIGDGPQLAKVQNHERIEAFGRMDKPALASIVRRCHVGLNLRIPGNATLTAFPVKVFEYLGSGLPVVSSPPSEAGSVFSSSNIGVEVPYGDIDQIVAEAERLLEQAPSSIPLTDHTRQEGARRFGRFVKSCIQSR